MEGESHVGLLPIARGLEGGEIGLWQSVRLQLRLGLRLGLQTLLELCHSRAVGAGCEDTSLESSAIETETVAVEALTDNFTSTDDDCTIAVVEG